jgi:acyl-CoA synthetase (AMP-forming)/AMP-acid ligase II
MPIVHLRSFKEQVPGPRYFNLYGPTETNVCTWYEIPQTIAAERVDPYPIGKTCSQLESIVVDKNLDAVPAGDEGELCIAGPNVMMGYWNLPERTAESFLQREADSRCWYRTGDIVRVMSDGNYHYLGRRDRMIKKRGNRIELGEIENCLYQHPDIHEVAVVALTDEAADVRIVAHFSSANKKPISQIRLKTFCSKRIPLYMIPDSFKFHDDLPKTSTGKIHLHDLQQVHE